MSSISSAAAQQKFTGLRKRLDQLGYRQPLGVESLPLVEKLFADLLHTTESLKKTKVQISKGTRTPSAVEAQIEPYRSDNAKLVKENSDLHHQLIHAKEDAENATKELKASLRKLEHENADLRFLNNQYVHKVRALEKESKLKTDKILQLQEKNFHAVVQTPGGRKKNIPFRRQRMEIDTTIPPAETTYPPITVADDPYVADLLKVADDKIAELTRENDTLQQEVTGKTEKANILKKQVDTRDNEIDRLSRMLEGGRPYDVVALETRNRSNERLISHLNIQIDYLQQRNADLQQQMDSAMGKARQTVGKSVDLNLRNTELERDLQDVDRMAQMLQLDKETAIRMADREIMEAKAELMKSRDELGTMDIEVARLRRDKETVDAEYVNLQDALVSEKADRKRLEDLLDKVQEDKRRLGNRVNKLTANERDLVLEIDRFKHKNGYTKKRGKSPDRLQQFLKGVEEERDYWKGEVEVLQKLLRSRSASPTRSKSPVRASRSPTRTPTKSPTRAKSPSRSLTSTPSKPKSRSSSPSKKEEKMASQYDAILRVLEEERDHYKRECEILRAMKHRPVSPTRPLREDSSELLRLTQERDELQGLLDKFERHMAEIQANVKVLTNERDNISAMYEETHQELDRVRREVVRSPKSAKTSLAAQAVLRRVENERDDAVAELRRMSTERDSLRERLKIATEAQLSDRARMDQRVEDAENAQAMTAKESNQMEAQIKSCQRMIETLENRSREQVLQISNLKDEAASQKTTATQMRLLAEQAERSLEDQTHKLSRKEADLVATENKVLELEQRIAELMHANRLDRDELSNLRGTIGALDREKDSLQSTVDEKTEHVASLEDRLHAKERSSSELHTVVRELEGTLERTKEQLNSKDREILSMRRQLDTTSHELTDTSRGREVALRENKRLQDDLANMTLENQNVNGELQDALEEREQLREQIKDYMVEVKRAEELMSAKENERTDLLDQYRSLSLEAERYETATHQLESEGSNLRLEMMTKDSEIRRLTDKCDMLERDMQERIRMEHTYEMQVSNLTKSVASLEEGLRSVEEEKHSLIHDISAVRDLCTKLELTKDNLQRQLTAKSLDHEKVQTIVDDLKYESGMLRSQVSTERSSLKNLEGLLISNREKEFAQHLAEQEMSVELQLLKDRLALQDAKMDSQNRELSILRANKIETESEAERLRRQLTNERFERERAVQELRRHGVSPPGESQRLSRGSPGIRSLSPSRLKSPDLSRSRSKSPSSRLQGDDPLTSIHTKSPSTVEEVEAWLDRVRQPSETSSTLTATSTLTSSRSTTAYCSDSIGSGGHTLSYKHNQSVNCDHLLSRTLNGYRPQFS